jgi:hypothetical protein
MGDLLRGRADGAPKIRLRRFLMKHSYRTILFHNTKRAFFIVDNTESLMIPIPAMSCRMPHENNLITCKH